MNYFILCKQNIDCECYLRTYNFLICGVLAWNILFWFVVNRIESNLTFINIEGRNLIIVCLLVSFGRVDFVSVDLVFWTFPIWVFWVGTLWTVKRRTLLVGLIWFNEVKLRFNSMVWLEYNLFRHFFT